MAPRDAPVTKDGTKTANCVTFAGWGQRGRGAFAGLRGLDAGTRRALLEIMNVNRKGNPMNVTSGFIGERLQAYKVRTSCGHVVVRMMRPATAGVAFDAAAEFQIDAPGGMPCAHCEVTK